MSATTVDLADRASSGKHSPFRRALGIGLILGVVAVYGATVGILPLMGARWVIVDVVSLGDAALIAIGLSAGSVVAARMRSSEFWPLVPPSLVAGGVAGGLLALLALAMQAFPLRQIFIALSPSLLKSLTFGLGAPFGGAVLIVVGALLAVLGAALTRAPGGLRKPVTVGLAFVIVFGVFQELIQIMMQSGGAIDALRQSIYTWEGLTLEGALMIFVLASGATFVWTAWLRGRRASASSIFRPPKGATLRRCGSFCSFSCSSCSLLSLAPISGRS